MTSNPKFRELMSRMVDDAISDDELSELNSLARDDAALRSQLVDYMLLDTLLHEDHGREPLTALVDTISESLIPQELQTKTISGPALPHRPLSWKPWGWLVVAASLIGILNVLFLQNDRQALASAARLVQAAMHTHAESIERIYVVEVKRGAIGETLVELPKDVRVTTQGDRFWVQMRGKHSWTWGRDARGAFWMTLGTNRAIVVPPEEMGRPLRYMGDLYALNLETLLQNLLKNCQLEMLDGPAESTIIVATPRRQWSVRPLRRATLEVDRETKTIRKLVIEREFDRSSSISTFTLVDSKLADESLYRPEGHLSEPYRIFSSETLIDRRRELVANWLGPSQEPWLQIPETQAVKSD